MEGSEGALDEKASVAGNRCGIPSVIGDRRWEPVGPTMIFKKVDSDSVLILQLRCGPKSTDSFGPSM